MKLTKSITFMVKGITLWDIPSLIKGYSKVVILVDRHRSSKYVQCIENLGYSAQVLSNQSVFIKQ